MKDRKIIKMEIPKVIWDAEMSIFNFRPILKTWMESVQDVVNKTSEIYSKQKIILKIMKTQVPKIKIENGELQIEGNFNFELSPTIINNDLIPIKKITFDWCVEISQAEMMTFGEDKILELFGERLKQDFIELSKQK